MVERGDDMVARFEVCASVEQHEEMVDDALRLRASKQSLALWEIEKKSRIEALGLKWEPSSSST